MKTVLVLEPDREIRTALETILEVEGYAPTGLGHGKPDVAVVDRKMLELAILLWRSGVPIVLTGTAEIGEAEAREIDSQWLRKPYELQDLIEAVDQATTPRLRIVPPAPPDTPSLPE